MDIWDQISPLAYNTCTQPFEPRLRLAFWKELPGHVFSFHILGVIWLLVLILCHIYFCRVELTAVAEGLGTPLVILGQWG